MGDSGRIEDIPPVYTRLKDLNIATELVRAGKQNAAIIAPGVYDAQAQQIQGAIEELTGVRIPVVRDDAPAAPIQGHLIALGNRSTNRAIEELYNWYHTLLDLRYPGAGGFEVRSLHNPFGNGFNVLFAGGSDTEGVTAATGVLIEKLKEAGTRDGGLSMGWLMEIRLGKDIDVPEDVRKFEIWEASAGYRSVGYFGWNSISKRMAMYYMTGDAFHAREVIRLAFPDAQARQEIFEIDTERIENKDEPLSGPYHYNAHMMILFWDLIEESPVFTDEERLRVTNAFSKQFSHPQEQGWRRQIVESFRKGDLDVYDRPAARVGSRHGQWSAIALYCLARYFQASYPDPFWAHCKKAAEWHFSPLHEHAWVDGEHDNLFWYNTGMAPILTYMLLTGDRKIRDNGTLPALLRGQEILISGREPDWALRSASIGFLHKAAYLMQDGRYLEYLRRTGVDLEVFRLGQSFWPEPHLKPALPEDLVGAWHIHPLPEPMWASRKSGISLEASFLFGSFRSAADASGDFILIKGMNGASRNPYHTFVVLELRLDGATVLEGYGNQALMRSSGLVEPQVAMDAALRNRDAVGQTAVVVGEAPRAAFCTWRRALVQRMGRYALVVDEQEFRGAHEEMEIEILWQGKGAWQTLQGGVFADVGGRTLAIHSADALGTSVDKDQVRMAWFGPVKGGQVKRFFTLIAQVSTSGGDVVCARLAENATALALPGPAVAAVAAYEGLEGELAVLGGDHLYGKGLKQAALGAHLFSSDAPVHIDWDFATGALEIVSDRDAEIHLSLGDVSKMRVDDVGMKMGVDGLTSMQIPAGRHRISGAKPDAGTLAQVAARLDVLLTRGRKNRREYAADRAAAEAPAPITPVFSTDVGGPVTAMAVVGGERICAVEGQRIHVLGQRGDVLRSLEADAPIQALRWWTEHHLLLAGCRDEKVIAFDVETGERQWEFVSEMDPAVFRAAKDYWFKSAPGHEGIRGLHTGVFFDGKSQAFVGSACTLEILDERGQLVRRLPVFWGPGSRFKVIDGPDGSLNLLIARQPTDSHALAVVNNRTMDPKQRGFHGVPPGHANIGGWACMSRKHIFYEDLDGDGKKKVVSEINGTWNRVTVWAGDGTPLHNAQFGPGQRIPAQNIRDLDVADVSGDGKKEILAATSAGMVVALDHRCETLWTRRFERPPTVLQSVSRNEITRIVVGLEGGDIAILDGAGLVLGHGMVEGSPTCIERENDRVFLSTDQGWIYGVNAFGSGF